MRMLNENEGVSEVFGYILLLGIIVTGLAILIPTAASFIHDSKTSAQYCSNEQTFTVVDSRLAKARFSTSIFQETPLKVQDGTVSINGSAQDSYIQMDIKNKTTGVPLYLNDTSGNMIYYNGNPVPISYRCPLGTIKVTTTDGKIVGYQGGGVWDLYPGGGCIMVTPPTFDYNGVTLTLPITYLNGSGTIGYEDSISMIDANSTGNATIIYPTASYFGTTNNSLTYANGTHISSNAIANLVNPVPPGEIVTITIMSDFYKGWGSYLKERTGLLPTYDDAGKIVSVDLSSGAPQQSGLVENGFNTKGMDTNTPEPLEEFSMDLVLRNSGNDYTITFGLPNSDKKTTPNPQLLISATKTKGKNNKDFAYIEIKYIDTTRGLTEIWSNTINFYRKSEDEMGLNMLDPSVLMTYSAGSSSQSLTWGNSPTAFDPGQDVTLADAANEQKSLYDISQHYMLLMASQPQYRDKNSTNYGPTYDVIGKDKYSSTSSFVLKYKSSEDIKYLYVTKGQLNVSLGAKS